MVMKGELGRTVALLGISAALVSCALLLGEGGKFDNEGTGGAKTTSGESTAASISGAPGDTGVTTASDVTSGPSGTSGPSTSSGMTTMTSSASTSMSGPTSTSTSTTSTSTTSTSSGGGGTTCPPGSVAELADDFSDPSQSQSLWNNDNAANVNFNGVAMVLKSGVEVYSRDKYPMFNCYAAVKVAGLQGSSSGSAHLNVKNSISSKEIQISADAKSNGYINFEAAGAAVIPNCLYSPTKHIYWRIRETSTEVYLETADASLTWTDQPCGNGKGVARKLLADVGFASGNVEVHMGVSGVTSPITFDDFDKP